MRAMHDIGAAAATRAGRFVAEIATIWQGEGYYDTVTTIAG